MNIRLHHVIATIDGATGMKIIRAIVNGERILFFKSDDESTAPELMIVRMPRSDILRIFRTGNSAILRLINSVGLANVHRPADMDFWP